MPRNTRNNRRRNTRNTEEKRFESLGIQGDLQARQVVLRIMREVYDVCADDALSNGKTEERMMKYPSTREMFRREFLLRRANLPQAVLDNTPDDNNLAERLVALLQHYKPGFITERKLARQRAAKAANAAQQQAQQAQQVLGVPQGMPEQQALSTQVLQQPPFPEQYLLPDPATWQGLLEQPLQTEQQAQVPPQPTQLPQEHQFDYSRPSVLPDADVQIIRADRPDQPLVIRLSDLLLNPNSPQDRSPEGDWINGANIHFASFRQALVSEGYLDEGETLWWNPLALSSLDPSRLEDVQVGENRLTGFNLISTIERSINKFFPHLRYPSPDPFGHANRSPLARPNFTIIIRGPHVTGGALLANQPVLGRPYAGPGHTRSRATRLAREQAQTFTEPLPQTPREATHNMTPAIAGPSNSRPTGSKRPRSDDDNDMLPPPAQRVRASTAQPIMDQGHEAALPEEYEEGMEVTGFRPGMQTLTEGIPPGVQALVEGVQDEIGYQFNLSRDPAMPTLNYEEWLQLGGSSSSIDPNDKGKDRAE